MKNRFCLLIAGCLSTFSASLICVTSLAAEGPRPVELRESSLENKLSAQWERFTTARTQVVTRALDRATPIEKRLFTREEWERVLEPSPEKRLTAADLELLKANQRRRILHAKTVAALKSVINFDELRQLPAQDRTREITRFCAQVPKGGMLHVHPSGTFGRATVSHLLQSRNPLLPFHDMLSVFADPSLLLYPDEREWLTSLGTDQNYLSLSSANQVRFAGMMFLPPGKHPFERFESVFTFLDYLTPDWAAYEEAILDFANRAVAKGVSYVEFTTSASPDLFALIEQVEKRTGLVIRVNRSFSRESAPGELDQRLSGLLALSQNPRLVGIDFLANESNAPALEKGQFLYGRLLGEVQAGRSQLHRTMHAGELGDPRNPRDAMILGAERLGHGVNLANDPVALEYAARNHIAVEVNLSSNLRLTSVERLSEHPYLDYLRLGLPISLSTDDEGIFDTDIARECELAIAETDVTYAEFKQMAFNSIRTSFANDSDKQELMTRLERAFMEFEGRRVFRKSREHRGWRLPQAAASRSTAELQ